MVKKSWLLMVIFALVFVTACSSGGTDQNNGNNNNTNTEQNVNNQPGETAGVEDEGIHEPVELVVYTTSGDSEESFNARFGDMIREKFPNVTLQYITATREFGIEEFIASGQKVDIYWDSIGYFPTGLQYEVPADMTDLIEKHQIDLTQLEPSSVDKMKEMSGGKMFGIPVFNMNMVLYYNKDIFDKFGVDYPTDGMTWDELADLSKQITRNDGNTLYYGYAVSQGHAMRLNQLSLPYLDPETKQPTIQTDEKWKTFFQKVYTNPMFPYKETGAVPGGNDFMNSKILAMYAMLSNWSFNSPEFEMMNWDMVALPTFEEAPGVGSQPYPNYFAVAELSEHKDEAMKVIKFLISKEAQLKLSKIGVVPTLEDDEVKNALGSESIFKNKNWGAVFYHSFAPIPYKDIYDSTIEKHYREAILPAQDDINTAFRVAAENASKAYADEAGQ
ncbi:ABC transporter substrate-binding protein [Marinicrinis lubricantis]|uniref:ABC transporter substrate-binding protein n=1 Tax=Marinicrinis lubricantis TaxID=2086470 RepID=A0ABW1IST4_9BACL